MREKWRSHERRSQCRAGAKIIAMLTEGGAIENVNAPLLALRLIPTCRGIRQYRFG